MLFAHLKRGQNKSVAIFFDNLDRRDQAIQEGAYLKASAIASDWECVVFICLRPSTFYESLKSGLLDSLAPKTFTVGAPDLPLLLKRRFAFAADLALGNISSPLLKEANLDRSVSFQLSSVVDIFKSCEFTARRDFSAVSMLAAVSNGNIRVLLDLTKQVLVSGHLDTKKILSEIKNTGKYSIPDFEATKTLLFGDYDHYDPKASLFINLFDIYHSDPSEHFIRIFTLEYLSRFESDDDSKNWIRYQDLVQYLETLYFDVATIQRHLQALAEGECILAAVAGSVEQWRGTAIRATSRGKFHIYSLASTFQYVDAVCVDTPIIDSTYNREVVDITNIQQRLSRTRAFLNYLNECADSVTDGESNDLAKRVLRHAMENLDVVQSRVSNRKR